jgi:glycosyltransferase involved in cell wall biosynthesis
MIKTITNISLIIPTYNNLKHIKNAYISIRKHYPEVELILLDDGSTDNTKEWLNDLDDKFVIKYRSEERVGHTILYDDGINLATKDIVGIIHADMIVGPNYIENLLKHLKPQTVVCATRIEPPLHPEGNEKIIRNFGLDFDDLNIEAFEGYTLEAQNEYKDQTTKGMFAPWIIYKLDFQAIGGHDPGFAPFPYEDSDIFQRWILAGYDLLQSRDSFVYHLTCRGHRWNEQVGKNDDYFTIVEKKAREYYIKKWGSWIKNDEYQYPIIIPVYKKKLILTNPNLQLEEVLEPWFNGGEDIIIEVDGNTFTQQDFLYIQQLNSIVKDSGEIGEFELGNIKIKINSLNEYQDSLIRL